MNATKIVPRWEWRCFAPCLATIAQQVGLPADAAPHESDETYFLNLAGPASENVKVREGVLDVKRLRQTNDDGIELWEPVLKAHFPLNRDDVVALVGAWTPPAPAPSRESYTIEQLVDDVITPRPALRAIKVHKSRRDFAFAGCRAELVRLSVDSVTLQSFSLEDEDPKRVLAALLRLGLDGHANTNYPLGLKRALGLQSATT